MKTLNQKLAASFAVLFLVTVAVTAQTPSPEPVTEAGFRSRVFQVKHRNPNSLANVVRTLGSGAGGSAVTPNAEFRTLSVRDFPDKIAVIEEAIRMLDVPGNPRPNIELNIHVLLVSKADTTGGQTPPSELNSVLAELRESGFKSFELATSITQRITETDRGHGSTGTARVSAASGGNLNLSYNYGINSVSVAQSAAGASAIQIGEFAFTATAGNLVAKVQTALNLKDGEKVIVGTAAIEDRSLVVVLTAKLLK